MKVGDLVYFIGPVTTGQPFVIATPLFNKPYTVRATEEDCGLYIHLEEIVNPISTHPDYLQTEPWYPARRFRKIEFPPAIEAEIKECLTREFESV